MSEERTPTQRRPLPGDLPLAAPPGVRVTRYGTAGGLSAAAHATTEPWMLPEAPVAAPLPIPAVAEHQAARPALWVGIFSLAGVLLAGVGLLFAPFAWALGRTAVREIDAAGGALTGRGAANAGRILGIVGTALMLLGIVAVVGLVALGTLLTAPNA